MPPLEVSLEAQGSSLALWMLWGSHRADGSLGASAIGVVSTQVLSLMFGNF